MSANRACLAVVEGSEKVCASCHLRWDITDPEPPQCKRDRRRKEDKEARQIREHREASHLPEQLPVAVLDAMAKAYKNETNLGNGPRYAMHRAYRIMRDELGL